MTRSDPDTEMVRAVLGGDAEAFRGLVERYEQRIYHVVFGVVRNPEDARELAQEAFVKAFRSLDRFRLESRFYTWLCRIAINLGIDHLRKMKHRSHAEYDDERAAEGGAVVVELSSRIERPDKNVARKHLHERIMAAFDALPEDQRAVMVLRELDELSYREIAEVLEVPEGTVMSRLYYARRKLQELLAEDRP
jgi:RNA polymerase sigma-70 factor (ECF subfamily)